MKFQKYFFIIFLIYNSIEIKTSTIKQVSISEFGQLNPNAQILQCTKNYSYNFKNYPLYKEHAHTRFPNQGLFNDTYIVSVPNGIVNIYKYNFYTPLTLVFLNEYFIKECQIKELNPFWKEKTNIIHINKNQFSIELNGSVAICWHPIPEIYGHFILDVLCQLALLEIHNIEYDHLCIPYSHNFMQELLDIWDIDTDKIIPYTPNIQISADKIILPTAVTQTSPIILFTNYTIDFLIQYVREKLLKNVQKNNSSYNYPKKIFISRKDGNFRKVPNEDEIFKEFENQKFKRYELSSLSMVEQILLFNNAEEIVSFIGSGSTNIIFTKPGTKYIEIIQTMIDATFFFLADIMKLNYYYINDSTYHDFLYGNPSSNGRNIPIVIIQNFLEKNSEL